MAVTKELHGKLSSTLITWRQVESINCVWRLQVQMSPNYRLGTSSNKLLVVCSFPGNIQEVFPAFIHCNRWIEIRQVTISKVTCDLKYKSRL